MGGIRLIPQSMPDWELCGEDENVLTLKPALSIRKVLAVENVTTHRRRSWPFLPIFIFIKSFPSFCSSYSVSVKLFYLVNWVSPDKAVGAVRFPCAVKFN